MFRLINELIYIINAIYNPSYFKKVKGEQAVTIEGMKIPVQTQGANGLHNEPISFVILAKSIKTFEELLKKTGWFDAEKVSFYGSIKGTLFNILNLPFDRFQLTPYFWNGKTQDYNIQKPTKKHTIRERHHARFWKTNFKTKAGLKVFVGMSSYDNGMNRIFSHTIDPNIDKEREYLFSGFKKTKMIRRYKKIKFSEKKKSKIFNGESFRTDGFGYLIYLK